MRSTLLIDASRLPTITLMVTLAVALGLALSACAPQPSPPDEPGPADDIPVAPATNVRRDMPLPPGAELDEAHHTPADGWQPQELDWEGSLRPVSVAAPNGDEPTPTLDAIRKRGRLIVGIDQSLNLLSFRDTASGQLRGFEVDLAHEIANDIFKGVDPDGRPGETGWVDFRFVDSAARSGLLKSGEVDVVIRTMSITPERAKEIEFSTPYLTSRVRVLAPRDRGIETVEGLAGRTVCIVDGTNLLQMAGHFAPDSQVLRTRTWSDCLMATQQFQADAIMADDVILAGIAAQDPYAQILPGTLSNQYYGVGLPKEQEDLVRQVNATLERVRSDGTWYRLYSEWLAGAITDSTPPPLMYREEEQ